MTDTTNTIIEYDFSAADAWRERVVTIAPCPGKDPPSVAPIAWRHERIACDDTAVDEDPCVRVMCTCGWRGPPHKTETEAIEAFNKAQGMETKPLSEWTVHQLSTARVR
jgi:hypothetical protein